MPHCVIECSRSLLGPITGDELVGLVHDTAMASGLFEVGDVKVRLSVYDHFTVGGKNADFVHLIFYVLAGRSDEQKRELSKTVVRALLERLPEVPSLSMDVRDMRREAFSNRKNCLQ